MNNGLMGVKYVKDEEVCWIPVVRRRRKKSASRSEESKSSRNLNVNDRRSLVWYRKVDRILGIYIEKTCKLRDIET